MILDVSSSVLANVRKWSGAALVVLLAACSSTRPSVPAAVERARAERDTGDSSLRLDSPVTAARAYARGLEAARSGDQDALAADLAYRLGLAHLATGDAAAALTALDEAVLRSERSGARGILSRALLTRARVGSGSRISIDLQRALTLAREDGDRVLEALALIGQAAHATNAQAETGFLAQAATAAGGRPEIDGPIALIRARRDEPARPEVAKILFQQAADSFRTTGDRAGLLAALSGLARTATTTGAWAEAAAYHRRAAEVATALGRNPDAAEHRRQAEAVERHPAPTPR